MLGQVYSRMLASDLKEILTLIYPDEHPVKLIHAAGMPDGSVEAIPLYAIDHSEATNHLSSLYLRRCLKKVI